MKQERSGLLLGGLVGVAVIIWLGFLVHVSPRFPGSGLGLLLGLSAALTMLVPLLYSAAKRIKPLQRRVTRRVPMRTWLSLHMYAGVLAPILALLHCGHRFASPLGIFLMTMTLVVMLSGFVGRYLLQYASGERTTKQRWLVQLRAAYEATAASIAQEPTPPSGRGLSLGAPLRWALARAFLASPTASSSPTSSLTRAAALSEAIADVEYAVKSQELFQRAFRLWLKAHGVLAAFLYGSLTLHVWLELRLGLRWLS